MPRAMVIESFDQPLRLTEQPRPEPAPGEALIEVAACGVCYSDVKTWRGRMPWSAELPLPHVPGHEICGRVVAVDPGSGLLPGALVLVHHFGACGHCEACRSGHRTVCEEPSLFAGFTTPGGFQELLCVPADQLVPLPETISPTNAAPIACAVATAYRAVMTRGGLRADDRVLVIGLGGVGLNALQIAVAAGSTACGMDASPDALRTAQSLGLPVLRHDVSLPDIARLLDGRPTLIIDAAGVEQTLALAARVAGPGARIVVVGYGPDIALTVPTLTLVARELQFLGSRAASRADLVASIELVATGRIQTVVSQVLPLEAANQALRALEQRSVSGRVVLHLGGAQADRTTVGEK